MKTRRLSPTAEALIITALFFGAILGGLEHLMRTARYDHLYRDTTQQARILAALAAHELHGAPCTTDTHCQQVAR